MHRHQKGLSTCFKGKQLTAVRQHAIDAQRTAPGLRSIAELPTGGRSWFTYITSMPLQVVAQDQHVGSHLFAGCALLGQFVLGIIWAGLIVSAVSIDTQSEDT